MATLGELGLFDKFTGKLPQAKKQKETLKKKEKTVLPSKKNKPVKEAVVTEEVKQHRANQAIFGKHITEGLTELYSQNIGLTPRKYKKRQEKKLRERKSVIAISPSRFDFDEKMSSSENGTIYVNPIYPGAVPITEKSKIINKQNNMKMEQPQKKQEAPKPKEEKMENEIINGFRVGDKVVFEGRKYIIDKFNESKKSAVLVLPGEKEKIDLSANLSKLQKIKQRARIISLPGQEAPVEPEENAAVKKEKKETKKERHDIEASFNKGQKVVYDGHVYIFDKAYETPGGQQYATIKSGTEQVSALLNRIQEYKEENAKPVIEKSKDTPKEVKKEKKIEKSKINAVETGESEIADAFSELENALELGGVDYRDLAKSEKGNSKLEEMQDQMKQYKLELKSFEDRLRVLDEMGTSTEKRQKEFGYSSRASEKLNDEVVQIDVSRRKILAKMNLLKKQIDEEKADEAEKKKLEAEKRANMPKAYEAAKKKNEIEELRKKIAEMKNALAEIEGTTETPAAKSIEPEVVGEPTGKEKDEEKDDDEDIGPTKTFIFGKKDISGDAESIFKATERKKWLDQEIPRLQAIYNKLGFFERSLTLKASAIRSQIKRMKKESKDITRYLKDFKV